MFITGASSGIGAHRLDRLQALAAEIVAAGGCAVDLSVDMTRPKTSSA